MTTEDPPSPWPLRKPVVAAVRRALQPLVGKPYNEAEARKLIEAAFLDGCEAADTVGRR